MSIHQQKGGVDPSSGGTPAPVWADSPLVGSLGETID